MSQSTRSSTRPLSEVARHLVIPTGIATTGWPAAESKLRQMGITFDGWQVGSSKLILGKRQDGLYAATIGGVYLSLPRQVGKTFMLLALMFALCLLFPRFTVLWTAHRLKTAGETFKAMQGLARRAKIAPLVAAVRRGSGDWAIEFTNGSRILFGAREAGFGRGFAEVDAEVFDEAQILTDKALDDMLPAANASRQSSGALVIYAGTPPTPADPSEVFTRARVEALSGEAEDLLWIECSAAPGTDPTQWAPGFIDFDAVAEANPSYPLRTPRASILRMAKQLSKASLRREGLGIWDDAATGVTRLIPVSDWEQVLVSEAPPTGVRSFGMVFDFDSNRGALAGAVKHADGVHLELLDAGPVSIDALADWLTQRWRQVGMIAIAGGGSSKALGQALRDEKVPERVIRVLTTPEVLAGNAMLLDAITKSRAVTIPRGEPTDALEESVKVSDQKVSTAGWRWVSTGAEGAHLPMEALSVALWAARTNKRRPGRKQVAS